MEFLGTMIGHGKMVTRKGTKKSGLTYTASSEQGEVGLTLRDVNGVTNVEINIYKDGGVHTLSGSINSLYEYLNPTEA